MKITGRELSEYEKDDTEEYHSPVFLDFGEVIIEAGPNGLRRLSNFLKYCAKEMEKGREQDHFHFNGNINDRPQIVIVNKKIAKRRRAEQVLLKASRGEK